MNLHAVTLTKSQINAVLAPASVFKDNFSIDWLIHITGKSPSNTLEILEISAIHGILTKSDFSHFRFSDTSVQAEFRKSLTADQNASIHEKLNDLLSNNKTDDIETARMISGCFSEADNDLKKCAMLSKAGDIYLTNETIENSISCYFKALQDLSRFDGRHADDLYIDIAIKYSQISDFSGDTNNNLKILRNALNRAEKIKNISAAALLQMHIAKNEWYCANYPEAIERFHAGLREVNSSDDPVLYRSTRDFRIFFNFWQGNFKEAVAIYEDKMSETEVLPHDNFHLMAESAAGICCLMTGEMAQGMGMIKATCSRCKKLGDPFLNAFNHMMMACSLIDIYRVNESFDYIRQADKDASNWPRSVASICSHLLSAYAHYINKNSQLAIKSLKEFLNLRTHNPQMAWPFAHMLKLCWAIELGHLPPVSGISLRQEIETSLKTKNPFLIGIALRYEAFLQQKNQASSKNIYRLLRESVKWLEKTGHLIELNRTRRILLNQYLLDGKETMAKQIRRFAADDLSKIPQYVIPDDLKPLIGTEPVNEQQLHSLFFLTEQIMEIENDNIIIYQLLIGACRLIGAERGAVFSAVDSNADVDDTPGFSLLFSYNLTDAQFAEPAFDFAKKIIQSVMQTGTDVIKSRSSSFVATAKKPLQSLICLPLKLRDKPIGAIYHDNRFIPPAFTDENVMALKYVAALMTLVIEKQRLARKLDDVSKKAIPPELTSRLNRDNHGLIEQNKRVDTLFNRPNISNEAVISSKKRIKTILSLKNVERNHILETLQITGWKVRGTGGAAELLDIHPSTLYSRMKKLGIRKKN